MSRISPSDAIAAASITDFAAATREALEIQDEVISAYDDLKREDHRGKWSKLMRRYGYLGDALDRLSAAVKNLDGLADDRAAENPPLVEVPNNVLTLPPGWGFRVVCVHSVEGDGEKNWGVRVFDANFSLISDLGVTFYVADEIGLHTVAYIPAGWYGSFRPIELTTDQRMAAAGHEKPKRKKFSQMTDEERTEALKRMRERLSDAEAEQVKRKASQNPEPIRDEVRRKLAKGEFPTDNMGTDSAGAPITPPEKLKDVWGHQEPPEEPPTLPVTDEEHEATLARLRKESDAAFESPEGLSGPTGPYDLSPTPQPRAVQINTDGTISSSQAFQPDNDPLPEGAQDYADQLEDLDPSNFGPPDEHGKVWPRRADRLEGDYPPGE